MDHYPPSTPLLENCSPGSDSMQRLVVHLDLFSGIGGFALAAQMIVTPHEDGTPENPVVVVEYASRDFRAPKARVMRWDNEGQVWSPDDNADATKLKQPGGEAQQKYGTNEIVEAVKEGRRKYSDILAYYMASTGAPKGTAKTNLRRANALRLILPSTIKGEYELQEKTL